MAERNSIEFKVWARHALFTDPLTRIGGEKCSYHVPTYEALKGIAKSIYWKPTFIWLIDEVRVMRRIRTQTKGTKPLNFGGVYPSKRTPSKKEEPANTLAIYTFLTDVEYQVRAHFEWNKNRPELEGDRVEGKHNAIAHRMLERGGRQDIFLGTRDCQGYVEPCVFAAGGGEHDGAGELAYGLMFHGFDYPDETGVNELRARFWKPTMVNGRICFPRPEICTIRKFVREMTAKKFGEGTLLGVEYEAAELGPEMSWIQKLHETYERCKGYEPPGSERLMPVSHTPQQAHIEITLDANGNFKGASVVEKKETVIPATEKSAGRTGKTPPPHPLCDKVQFCAADYPKHGGEKPSFFKEYEELLSTWCDSEFGHSKAKAVLAYARKHNVVADLIKEKILYVGADGKLLKRWSGESQSPVIFRLLTAKDGERDQGDAFVRWHVREANSLCTAVWEDESLQEAGRGSMPAKKN